RSVGTKLRRASQGEGAASVRRPVRRLHPQKGFAAMGRQREILRLERPEGAVVIEPLESGACRVTLVPRDLEMFIPIRSRETNFPPQLIALMADKLEYAWLCDSIARQEEASYVVATLDRQLFSYFPRSAFAGKRILDFGCGT